VPALQWHVEASTATLRHTASRSQTAAQYALAPASPAGASPPSTVDDGVVAFASPVPDASDTPPPPLEESAYEAEPSPSSPVAGNEPSMVPLTETEGDPELLPEHPAMTPAVKARSREMGRRTPVRAVGSVFAAVEFFKGRRVGEVHLSYHTIAQSEANSFRYLRDGKSGVVLRRVRAGVLGTYPRESSRGRWASGISSPMRPSARPPCCRDALFTLGVALAARLAVALWASARFPPAEDGHYYDVLAHRVASGQGFTWLWPDGAVTFAAHYPVGYPALLATAYAVFGASTAVAMGVNATLGAVGAFAAHRLADASGAGVWAARAAGLSVALHPALVPYTAALMTEGVTASLLLMASAAVARARAAEHPLRCWSAAGAILGAATLVRPQSLVLAPFFGGLACRPTTRWRGRLAAAAVTTAVALACVAPWTARNCVRMHRCALVSVNGGWNLLIGAASNDGAWQPVAVPVECATVWDEAAKDTCFEHAAERRIADEPLAWLALVPAKLAVTFDYFGAAPWYLHASSAASFGERAKTWLGALETVVARTFLLLALAACVRSESARPLASRTVLAVGALTVFTRHAWPGYLAVPVALALAGPKAVARAPLAVPLAASVVAATAMTHAVFFGAGRYGLVVAPFMAVVAALAGRMQAAPDLVAAAPSGMQD
jgi:4-amino-4-deoxy-L-arabinose transferase-like glycosyltransferase